MQSLTHDMDGISFTPNASATPLGLAWAARSQRWQSFSPVPLETHTDASLSNTSKWGVLAAGFNLADVSVTHPH